MNNLDLLLLWLNGLRAVPTLAELFRQLRLHPPGLDELRGFVRFDDAHYQRVLVSESPLYRALVLCWQPGQCSPIHDHSGSACSVLIVGGTATETRFALTPERLARPTETLVYGPGTVFGGQDGDVHTLGNCHDTPLISAHIYAPPLLSMGLYEPEAASLGLAEAAA